MKSVFITGASRGIGVETARQMGKLGYRVILGVRNPKASQEVADALSAEGITVDVVAIDVSSDESVKAAAAEIAKKTNGVLDALINNAGINEPGTVSSGSLQVNLDNLRRCYEVNVIGTARVVNHFLDLVKAAPAGRIVNVSSIMGSLELKVASLDHVAYNASKTALNMYTVDLAMALKDTKIKVNAGHPGWVKTDMGGEDAPLSVEEGAKTSVYLATLPEDGPTGGYFHMKERLPW